MKGMVESEKTFMLGKIRAEGTHKQVQSITNKQIKSSVSAHEAMHLQRRNAEEKSTQRMSFVIVR